MQKKNWQKEFKEKQARWQKETEDAQDIMVTSGTMGLIMIRIDAWEEQNKRQEHCKLHPL